MIIYKATNLVNGKNYVGQTTRTLEKRKREHLTDYKNDKKTKSKYFYRSLNKYGEDSFVWESIDTAKTQDELNIKEKFWIKELNSISPNGYNLTNGGEFGKIYGEAEIRRVKNSKETNIERFGRKVININTKEIYRTATDASLVAGVSREAIAYCCKGVFKKAGEYTYAYLEDYEENKEYYNNYIWENYHSEKVINLSNGKIYKSMIEAEQDLGIAYQMISNCCRKAQKSAGGYFWAYYDKYNSDNEYKDYYTELIKNFKGKNKKVINLDTFECFNSIADASKKYNTDPSSIMRVCQGKNNTGGGFKWVYIL